MIIPVKPDAYGNIDIFYEGDENVTQVHFENPDSDFKWALHYLRRGDKRPYNVPLDEADGELIWTVALADTEKPGTGFAQMVGSAEGQTKHSRPYTVTVGKSLGKPGSVPSVEKAFGDAVAADAAAAKRAAEAAADTLAQVKDDLAAGKLKGEKGDPGKDAPQIDDGAISRDTPWSSRQIIDTLCPKLDETGNPVTCYPVAGYPLGVKATWEPTQAGEGEPYPAGGGPNLLDISKCTLNEGAFGLNPAIVGDVLTVKGTVTSVAPGGTSFLAVLYTPDTSLSGKGYKITAFTSKGSIKSIYGLRTETETSIAIGMDLVVGQVVDVALRIMVSKDTPTAYAPYENIRPISGRDNVTVERCGKNLLKNKGNKTINGIEWTFDDQGLISIKGTIGQNLSDYYFFGSNINNPEAFTATADMILSSNYVTNNRDSIFGVRTNNGLLSNSGREPKISIPSGTKVYGVFMRVLNAAADYSGIYAQLEFGSTQTIYTPYRGDTLDLQLPGTVYGGYVDAVTGDGTSKWGFVTLDGTEAWTVAGKFLDNKSDWYYVSPKIPGAVNEGPLKGNEICSHYPHADVANNNAVKGCAIVWGAIRVRWGDTIPDNADGWKAYLAAQYAAGTPVQIAYKLAQPVPIQATGAQPIPALAGCNTVLTDADTVTVTGRADPAHAIAALQAQLAVATQQLVETQEAVVDTTGMAVDYIYEQDSQIIGGDDDDDQTNAMPT